MYFLWKNISVLRPVHARYTLLKWGPPPHHQTYDSFGTLASVMNPTFTWTMLFYHFCKMETTAIFFKSVALYLQFIYCIWMRYVDKTILIRWHRNYIIWYNNIYFRVSTNFHQLFSFLGIIIRSFLKQYLTQFSSLFIVINQRILWL